MQYGIAQKSCTAHKAASRGEERKVSQDTFYIDTDIHIARIESGKTNITISTLDDICKYFSITPAEFFAALEEQPPEA
ncbi:MAG: helix-turn-helix domain-containing protein [Prevotellaceae bacterium]|jgi:transcriptional regulator with XRE-family HTH domain|nr:helix-turn-helix domain-containing protein [Prevotellaceae bacterium]